jgi:hypothetical protein
MGTDGAGDQSTQGWDQHGQFFGERAQPADLFGQPTQAGSAEAPGASGAGPFGIAQVVAGPFAGIPAIVLGAMSLRQIRLSGEDGHGLAATGLVLGIAGAILSVLVIVAAVVFIQKVASTPTP